MYIAVEPYRPVRSSVGTRHNYFSSLGQDPYQRYTTCGTVRAETKHNRTHSDLHQRYSYMLAICVLTRFRIDPNVRAFLLR
jgi:hypothetical protein